MGICPVPCADLAYPVTGTTREHKLAWSPGTGHTTSFLLESAALFGPADWRRLGEVRYEDVCTTSTTRAGIQTVCQTPATDRTVRYRITPINGAGPGAVTTESEIIRCCRIGEFNSLCYINLPVPTDCS